MSFQACDYSLACSLRSISQHQKNGVLTLKDQRDVISISIVDGVIVGAFAQGNPLNRAIITRMSRANLIDPNDKDIDILLASPPSKLYQRLVGGGYLSHEMFVRLKFTYERDVLDSLINFQSDQVDFKPQLVQADDALSQSIYPCQLLLDFLEIELDERRFADIFGLGNLDEVFVRPQIASASGLTETEQTVWELIGRGAYIEDIFSTSILSMHQAQDALLALHEQRFIAIGGADTLQQVVPEKSTLNVVAQSNIDLPISSESVDDDLQLASEDMEAVLSTEIVDTDSLNDVSEVYQLPDSAVGPYAHENSNAAYIVPDEVTLPQDVENELASQSRQRRSKRAAGVAGLATEDFLHRYLLATTVLFLLVLSIVLPQKLAGLFEAIGFFVTG